MGGCSYEKDCSVSGLKRPVRAEDKGPRQEVRRLRAYDLLSPSFHVGLPGCDESGAWLSQTWQKGLPADATGLERLGYVRYSAGV